MKQMPKLRRYLPLPALAASLQLTLGYYDPSNQRWISRDPLPEKGFLSLATTLRNGTATWASAPSK